MITEIKQEEIGKLLPLIRRIYPVELGDSELLDWCKNSGSYPFVRWFAVEEGEKPVAFTRWYSYDVAGNEVMLMLSWTATLEEMEGKGIATWLVEGSFKQVKDYWNQRGLKISSVWVETDVENTRARKFYAKVIQKLGFAVEEKTFENAWKKGGVVFITGQKER